VQSIQKLDLKVREPHVKLTALAPCDLGYSGDIFQVYDNGALIGTTSAVSATGNGTTYVLGQANQAFADAAFSSGSFILGAGSHSITGVMIQSANDPVLGTAFNATQGAVLLAAPVPEPTTWMLMSGGLLGLVLLSRARQTRRLPQALITGAVVAAALAATPASAATVTARVIAFNDFHGNLQSPGKFNLVTSTGGADYLAAYIASLKAANPNNIVVHAGDMVGASPLISAFFHDEGAIETMNQLGVDIASVGNHEFDAGSAELLRKQNGGVCFGGASGWTLGQNSCEGGNPVNPVPDVGTVFQGAKFRYLSANVIVQSTGKPLFPAYAIREFDDVRVAFIGMTLKDTPTIVLPSGVAGLQFNDEADTVNALIPQLKRRGVHAIVVVVHQGGAQGAAPNFINDCSAPAGVGQAPITSIVSRLSEGVDMVISGHSHQAYNCMFPNAAGRMIPVTQASAFGRVLTSIDLQLDRESGKVLSITPVNQLVDRTDTTLDLNAPNVVKIQQIVAGYGNLVSGLTSQVVAQITADVPTAPNLKTCEKVGGDMIADGQLQATAPAAQGGAQIAFINAGGVRGSGFSFAAHGGNVTFGDAFTLQPFGNSLVTLTLTAADLKTALEQQFSGCLGQTLGTNRVMDPSASFAYSWDASKACGSKVQSAALVDAQGAVTDQIVQAGVVLNPTRSYRINVNNFLAGGGDGFSTFLKATSQLGGAQDIDSLIAYLANFNAPKPALNPASIKPRITQLNPAGITDGSSCQ